LVKSSAAAVKRFTASCGTLTATAHGSA